MSLQKPLSKDEQSIIDMIERTDGGRKLTEDGIRIALSQARLIGDLEGEPEVDMPLCGVIAEWLERKRIARAD